MMFGEKKLVYLLLILMWTCAVTGVDPMGLLGLGIAAGSALYSRMQSLICTVKECCNLRSNNFEMLDDSLRTHLFGQHIVHDIVLSALRAHFKEDARPKKALAISFHGLAGTGKTYVSQFIINSLFELGSKSNYAHFFTGRNHFSVENKVDIYKMNLIDWIRGNVSSCARSLFVFDEVDKMPKGLLDVITPFLDYHEEINGIDYRGSTFIFLSNTGGNLIVEHLLHMWENGKKREDITLQDFEELIRKGSFNEKGGLHRSEAIESNLIDHYVPFLPLEESHVRQCIQAQFRNRGVKNPHEEHIKKVLKYLTFGPEPHNVFSNSGCKRISSKVGALIEEFRYYKEDTLPTT